MNQPEPKPEPSKAVREFLTRVDRLKELVISVDQVISQLNEELVSLRNLLKKEEPTDDKGGSNAR